MPHAAVIAGAAMTRFGKHRETPLRALAAEAIHAAVTDAGISLDAIQCAYMGNAAAALITGQALIPGQAVLRAMGIGRIPVINVENACATSATAFHEAVRAIEAGRFDVVLVAGYEKLVHADKTRSFAVFQGAVDVEGFDAVEAFLSRNAARNGVTIEAGAGATRSLFMDLYAAGARDHMRLYGTTPRDFAAVCVKNARHGALNPQAQFREELSIEAVLHAPIISAPLTLPMCSPIGDGAAALVLLSEAYAQRTGVQDPVLVRASVLASGWDGAGETDPAVAEVAAQDAYRLAGIGPDDISVVELHDATAPAELMYYEHLGFAPKGEGARLLHDGETTLGGRIPVNPSGGLLRKGHPIGASGAAQLVELANQLRGRCGPRQVSGARIALAENGGGFIGSDVAAIVVSILEAERAS